jgi:hypothetical protein
MRKLKQNGYYDFLLAAYQIQIEGSCRVTFIGIQELIGLNSFKLTA